MGERDRIGDNVGEYGEVRYREPPSRLSNLPLTFYIVIILILKLAASYNLSYNIHHIISPNTIIAPDKELNKVLDKAFALAPNARYRYRTCSITASSPL